MRQAFFVYVPPKRGIIDLEGAPTRLNAFAMGESDLVIIPKRRGSKKAMVALARRIGVVLHRMWRDGTEFNHATPPIFGGI